MKKRRIQPKTCFMLGLAAQVVNAAAAVLMLLRLGPASMLAAMAFALTGGMMLFLCVVEKGDEKRGLRFKLLLLFLALLVSYFNLPPLNYLLDALLLPLLLLLYKRGRWHLPFALLLVAEAARMALRTVGVVDYFAPNTLVVEGAALLAVAALRFWALFLLYRAAAAGPSLVDETAPPRRLR